MPQGPDSGQIPLISDEKKFRIEALIDYISTSPENINYTMVREMLFAILTNNNHPYFSYYTDKAISDETGQEPIPEPLPMDPIT